MVFVNDYKLLSLKFVFGGSVVGNYWKEVEDKWGINTLGEF